MCQDWIWSMFKRREGRAHLGYFSMFVSFVSHLAAVYPPDMLFVLSTIKNKCFEEILDYGQVNVL